MKYYEHNIVSPIERDSLGICAENMFNFFGLIVKMILLNTSPFYVDHALLNTVMDKLDYFIHHPRVNYVSHHTMDELEEYREYISDKQRCIFTESHKFCTNKRDEKGLFCKDCTFNIPALPTEIQHIVFNYY